VADHTDPQPSPLTLFLAASASLIWLGYVVFAGAGDGLSLLSAPREWVRLIAEAFVPIAALFAILAAVKRVPGSTPIGLAADPLETAEADFTGIVTRVEAVRDLLAGDLAAVTAATRGLESEAARVRGLTGEIATASEAAVQSGAALAASLPPSAAAAADINRALIEAGAIADRQTEALAAASLALADGSRAVGREGQAAAGLLAGALAELRTSAGETRAAGEAALASITAEADRAFASTAEALDAVRGGISAQSHGLAASLGEARALLEQIGHESARAMSARLEALTTQANGLDARLQSQLATVEAVGTGAERSFQLLDKRLGHSADTSATTLDALKARIEGVTASIAALTEPLRDNKLAAGELEVTVSGLRETAMQTVDVLAETLPVRTVEASRAAETMTAELRALASIIDEAHAKAAGLASPIAESRVALLEATEGYAAQRVAIETAGQALVVELEQARQLIAQVEEQTRDTSLAAATRLVDAMTRVREVAQQTAGTMRETLDGVIGEARESLAGAADTAMRQSFAGPILAQAREAESLAQSASERTAASMAALAGTLKLLDARASDRSASLQEASATDLLATASFITDRLASKALSIASAMGKPMSDADWTAWRKGERSLFNRRALSLLEKREARALKEQIAADPELGETVRHYTADFAALLARTGDAGLAPALLSSDAGRLAAALMEVLED